MSGTRDRWAASRRWRAVARDDGNISLLTLGVLVLALMTLLVISAATSVHVQRLRLVHLADEMALDAADALDLDRYYAGEVRHPTGDAAIDVAQRRMEEAVAQHLAGRDPAHLEGVRVLAVTTPDGATAVVTLSQRVYPLFQLEVLMPFADGIEIRAVGSARTF